MDEDVNEILESMGTVIPNKGRTGMKIQMGGYVKLKENDPKKGNVKEGEFLTILDTGQEVESKTFKNPDGSPQLQFNFRVLCEDGQERTLSMNTSSRRNMFHSYGDDTADWVGKKAKIVCGQTTTGKATLILTPQEEVQLD